MRKCGYDEITGSGSRRKFVNKSTGAILSLHAPHPSPILKRYAVKEVLEHLRQHNLV